MASLQTSKGDKCQRGTTIINRFFQASIFTFTIGETTRTGSLFQKPFKRIEVVSDEYFSTLVLYIHTNPLRHRLMENFKEYQWSSYQFLLKNEGSFLDHNTVLDWFGGRNGFTDYHDIILDPSDSIRNLIIEDEKNFEG